MSRLRLLALLCAGSLVLAGCAADDSDAGPEMSDLEDGLTPIGKADQAVSAVTVYNGAIALREAAARTLYNLLDAAGASASTGGGQRALFAPGMGCITDGLATYCELYGQTEAGYGGYDGILHGYAGYSAASTLHDLIADGSTDSFVSTPWFACEKSGGAVWCGVEASEVVTLAFSGLEDSGGEFVYEGWAVSGGMATTTGRFRNGSLVRQLIPASIAGDSLYVLTIEPRRGDDPAPAATHVLAGPLTPDAPSDLTTAHPAALGTDFADAAGTFLLATPTSPATDDQTQGIWFVAGGAPSLRLPTLPEGWVYEGWVVGADGPISTGRFTSAAGADSDGAGPAAGPDAGPPFPGQDFIEPPLDLVGTTIVISVEPEPDNTPAPFAIKPLITSSVTDVIAPDTQALANTSDNRPSAVATLGY